MTTYYCFKRTSWKINPNWPEGLEPDAHPPGRIQAEFDDIEEAREWCGDRNAKLPKDDRKRKLGGMYEFTSDP